MVDDAEVRHYASLARLDLSEKEVSAIARDIEKLLETFSSLERHEGAEEAHFLKHPSPLREDYASRTDAAKIVENFPRKRGAFVKVPKGLKK